jgi:hypothetical protein
LKWLLSLAIILAIVGLLVPVWGVNTPFPIKTQVYHFSFGEYVTSGSNYQNSAFSLISNLSPEILIFFSVYIFTILIIINLLVIELRGLKQTNQEDFRRRIGPPLLIAGLMSLLSSVLFALLIPYAIPSISSIKIGFWGSARNGAINYGPQFGWFLQLASLLLIAASIIVVYRSHNLEVFWSKIASKRSSIAVKRSTIALSITVVAVIIIAGILMAPVLAGFFKPPAPPVVPGAPGGVQASYSPGTATVIWSAPSYNGGSPIVGYKVFRSEPGNFSITLLGIVTLPQYTERVDAFEGSLYYTIIAYNKVGDSPGSNSATLVIPPTPHITVDYVKQGADSYYWYIHPPSNMDVRSSDVTVIFTPSINGQPTISFGTYIQENDIISVSGTHNGTTYALTLLYMPTDKICYYFTFMAT